MYKFNHKLTTKTFVLPVVRIQISILNNDASCCVSHHVPMSSGGEYLCVGIGFSLRSASDGPWKCRGGTTA